MFNDFKKLHEQRKVSTLNPQKMTISDVKEYLSYRRTCKNRKGRPLCEKEHQHDITALRCLLEFPVIKQRKYTYRGKTKTKEVIVVNDSLKNCLMLYPLLKPKVHSRRKPPLKAETVKEIKERSHNVNPYDWKRLRTYALVHLMIVTGQRNKEIRLANVDDLDTENWTFTIKHPKGENTYAEPRTVPIHPDVIPVLSQYLPALECWKEAQHVTSRALFPSTRSKDGYLDENTIRAIAKVVQNDLVNPHGDEINSQSCRRTAIQTLLDNGVSDASASIFSGHTSGDMLNKHYGRKPERLAHEEIKRSWKN
ncbi:MAG: tyrosine-type recombinase/integrase [Methanomassiliicoccaceae archaeon]|nr:tyrosine-type recombinase/integrase [Methanomassiliicoccaceae archaeon]